MSIEVLRATKEWQRAGAYHVRIEGMNRQHHISLNEEFDEHDGENTRYIVLTDDGYPIATCRFYEEEPSSGQSTPSMVLGRVVVLPEYRGKGLGKKVVKEAEKWIAELGYDRIAIDSRLNAVSFYEKLGYLVIDPHEVMRGGFACIPMEKRTD